MRGLRAGNISQLALLFFMATITLTSCRASTVAASLQPTPASAAALAKRVGFLGAFYRPAGTIPFGAFSVYSKQRAPVPYPASSTTLFGAKGYCDAVAANGVSITSGYQVDAAKLANLTGLHVRWTRTGPSPFFDDVSHIEAPGRYHFGDFDSAQCALVRAHIIPTVALEAGPVLYNGIPNQYSPKAESAYKTAADFGEWCGAVVSHERSTFTMVHRYSLPGNEVNSADQKLFSGGDPEIVAYSEACYRAVKERDPHAFIYGFELNMDTKADAVGFVRRMYALGCKVGTCYDGMSVHMSLNYPIPSPATPCAPAPGGSYSVACLEDVRSAAHSPIHLLIGESVYTVPGAVANESVKAKAIVAEMKTFAALSYVDGVNYANIDECDLYPTGYFSGGCLVDSIGTKLPAYEALRNLAALEY